MPYKRVKRKIAEVYRSEALKTDKRLSALAFIDAGFPKSLKEFEEIFQVRSVKKREDGLYAAKMSLRNKKATVAVLSVEFILDPTNNILRLVRVNFRDKSWYETMVKTVRRNPKIPSSRFDADLKGYRIEKKN